MRRVVFAVGLGVSLVMVWRAQFGMDQFFLMVRGFLLYERGWWVPFGNPMSGGGFEPGGLTSLLTGIPLFLAEDPRVVGLSILLTHVVAWVLLDRIVADALGPRARALFAVFYWLNPWRMYFSAFVWNPNWLFVLGAAHFASAYAQRRRASFGASFVHVVAVGLAFQLHGSFLILAIASVLLVWRRYVRVHVAGAACGVLVIVASLVPWMLTALAHPQVLPMSHDGFLGRGLLHVYPVLRGIGYWLRYPVLLYGRTMSDLDFMPVLGASADAALAPVVFTLNRIVGPLSLLVSLAANVWFWRRRPQRRFRRFEPDGSDREWIHGAVRWIAIAALATFAASPTTIMMWQALIVLHAAVLPVVLWSEVLLRSRIRRRVRSGLAAWTVAIAVVAVAFAFAAPQYRRGGRDPVGLWIRTPRPMLSRLGVLERNLVVVDPESDVDSRLLDGRERWFVEDHPPRTPNERKM